MTTKILNVPISKTEETRLTKLSLSYGLNLEDFIKYILQEISSNILTESFEDYDNPKELKLSYTKALKDYRAGKFQTNL